MGRVMYEADGMDIYDRPGCRRLPLLVSVTWDIWVYDLHD